MEGHKSSSSTNHIVDVVMMLGGAKVCATKVFAGRPEKLQYAVDNNFESDARRKLHQELQVTQVSIGGGETTATVLAQADQAIQDDSKDMTLTVLHFGMAANAVLGQQAALIKSECPDFPVLERSIIERVLVVSRGSPPLIRLQVYHSLAGGQGSGMWLVLVKRVAEALATLGIPVSVEFDTILAIAFTGLSANCRLNVGATLPALIEYVSLDKSNPLIAKRLELGELPPFLQNQTLREQLILHETQAVTAAAFREKRDVLLPNMATQGEFGNVLIRETDFRALFDPSEIVRPAVSAAYHQVVKNTLDAESVDDSLFEREVWTPFGEPLRRPDIDSLAARCTELDFPSYLGGVKQPAAKLAFRLAFDLPDGGRFEVHDIDQLMSDSPKTFEEAAGRLNLLATSEDVVSNIATDCEMWLRQIAGEITVGERQLHKLFRQAKRQTIWSGTSRRVRLEKASRLLRAISDEHHELAAKLLEARTVLDRIGRQRRKLRRQLQQVESILASHLPRGDQARVVEFFQVCDDSAAFPQLFELPDKDEERRTDILCGLAAAITLDGLAALLQTRFADVREVARAIVFGEPAYRSPPVGGFRRQSEAKTLIVLPPIERRFASVVLAAVSELAVKGQAVVMNDTMKCGCGVLRVHYREVHRLDEVFCGLIRHNTYAAHARPDRNIVCLGGGKPLENLGITLNGEDLVFPTPRH